MGKLYPVEQRHVDEAKRIMAGSAYPIWPADAEANIAAGLARIEATPAVDQHMSFDVACDEADFVSPTVVVAGNVYIQQVEPETGKKDMIVMSRAQARSFVSDLAKALTLPPVKQSDGLAERVKEACAALVEMRIALMGGLAPVARAAVLDALPLAIRSLDITRMDSDGQ